MWFTLFRACVCFANHYSFKLLTDILILILLFITLHSLYPLPLCVILWVYDIICVSMGPFCVMCFPSSQSSLPLFHFYYLRQLLSWLKKSVNYEFVIAKTFITPICIRPAINPTIFNIRDNFCFSAALLVSPCASSSRA